MKFGYMMQVQMPRPWSETTEREAYWNAVEQAVAAEEAGFDRIWLTEQHFYVYFASRMCILDWFCHFP